MQVDQNDGQRVDKVTSHDSTLLVVGRWFRTGVLVTANLIVLCMFAAYFQNQRLDLLEIIGIVSNSFGIITGLLGVWFFFLSERLNRTTASNLERTTAVVDDLRNQMWQMIQQTFNTFVKNDEKASAEAAEEAVEKLRNPKTVSSEELEKATETIIKRLEVLEKQREISTIAPPKVLSSAAPEFTFHAGERVHHKTFGDGVVVSSKFSNNGEEVTVAFAGKGVKRLSVNHAPMQRVSSLQPSANGSDDSDEPPF